MHDQPPHPHHHRQASPRGLAQLRSSGRRLTRQREVIWAALTAEPDRHLSAPEVVERVRAELPRVNPSTVYRTLDLLVAEGLLKRTDLGRDRAFYEPAQGHRHHHVVCRRCGAVAHIHDEVLGELPALVDDASGFAIGHEELTLFGLCQACRTAGRADPRYRDSNSSQGARMSEHEHTHDHPHTHQHNHGPVTHSHPHTSHDHEHVEHEHEHRHGDVVHSHPHVHEAGLEHEDEHEHPH
jgi:Fe2+ or Zn2+ uptake regulation protein